MKFADQLHEPTLVATIAAGFTAAWLLGLLSRRLGLSPIVGYLVAGILIGPHTPGFVGDVAVAQQLAEVGVILLMFGVGLHFHFDHLLAVKHVAVPGAVVQSVLTTLVAILVFAAFGIPWKTGMVIGMAMSVASTVVLMRVLLDAEVLDSPQGHVAVGWLIVEDIFTVILLVLIPILGSSATADSQPNHSLWQALALALVKLAALTAIVLFAGSRVIPWILVRVARLRSRELFTLTVLVFSIAVAAASYFFFGASMALGAFLAGMVVAQSPVSHQAAADALPMRDAFAVLFFVSVGMLFDPGFVFRQPLMVLAAMGIILVVKPLAALAIAVVLGQSVRAGFTVAIGLAQIGEFSFILSDLAQRHGLMSDIGNDVLVSSAIISIALNPLLFRSIPRIELWARQRPAIWRLLSARAERHCKLQNSTVATAKGPESRNAIIVGYGPVGRSVDRLLRESSRTTVVIDLNMDTVSALRAEGRLAIFGDASSATILEQAGIASATHLILTLPQTSDRTAVVTAARALNPTLRIIVRARYLQERDDLEQAGATSAVFEEAEAAVALARLVLADTGVRRAAAEQRIKDLRLQLISENISNIRTQRVRSVMVPWPRVRWLSATADLPSVLTLVAQERYSRWPVVATDTGRPIGYLLSKDLIANAATTDWSLLIRPLKSIHPDDTVDATLTSMQSEGATIYIVQDERGPVGIITLEDILEQVVGQIEDEYPHAPPVLLSDAVAAGGMVIDLAAKTGDEAIRELATAIPATALPEGVDRNEIIRLALQREAEFSTDLGIGVAVPHARCPGLSAPFVVFGRSASGLLFSPQSSEPVYLLFLVVTASEEPDMQLALLSQVASACREQSSRDALKQTTSVAEIMERLDSSYATKS